MKQPLKPLAALLILATLTAAQSAVAVPVQYFWTAPTTGSEAVRYAVEIELAGGEWILTALEPTENTVTIEQTPNTSYRIRVAGIDSNDHQGTWSIASTAYNYTAPGACGAPWHSDPGKVE